jgi:hypothetical protein
VLTNKAVTGVTLDISGRRVRVNLVVMLGLVLDVIIGMNKMTDWGAVIDARHRTLSLKDPQGRVCFRSGYPDALTSPVFHVQYRWFH